MAHKRTPTNSNPSRKSLDVPTPTAGDDLFSLPLDDALVPSAPSDDLELEDDEGERQIHRARLPERREESSRAPAPKSLDTVFKKPLQTPVRQNIAEPEPSTDSFESNPEAVMRPQVAPKPMDEIDEMDRMDEIDKMAMDYTPDLNSPRVRSDDALATSASVDSAVDDLDEFLDRTSHDEYDGAPIVIERPPLAKVEKLCLAGAAVLLVGGLIWFAVTLLRDKPGVERIEVTAVADTPLKGDLVTIDKISASWRDRAPADRVGLIPVDVPVPAQVPPAIIPEVRFTISPDTKGSGYVRVIFKNTQDKEMGDTRVIRVVDGKLQQSNQGEVILDATSGSVYCSTGFPDRSGFLSYAASDETRWHVEVAESARYDASDHDWKPLGAFNVRNQHASEVP